MEKFQPGQSYHIFNHANGFENIFTEDENYRFFLEKYRLYIQPVAETYAYCLLPNHFHLVVRIRKKVVIEELYREFNFSKVQNFGKVETPTNEQIELFISKQFSKLFSCYTQSFNKVNHRIGSLFMKNFKREIILDKVHFLNTVTYTHRNPIHHGFCKDYTGWGYCSYTEITEGKSNIVEVEKLMQLVGGKDLFIETHRNAMDKFIQSFVSDV